MNKEICQKCNKKCYLVRDKFVDKDNCFSWKDRLMNYYIICVGQNDIPSLKIYDYTTLQLKKNNKWKFYFHDFIPFYKKIWMDFIFKKIKSNKSCMFYLEQNMKDWNKK